MSGGIPARAKPKQPKASPAERTEGKLRQVVSVRFSEEELLRVQAYAVVFDLSPNEVIRQACDFFLSHQVDTPEYTEALDAYRQRTEQQVAALEQLRSVR